MEIGHFYFLTDQYFQRFSDPYLMRNKETVNGKLHGRPCFYAFLDERTQLFWVIPISSQIEKYKTIYQKKIERHKQCDTIAFAPIFGHESAFLIQNMCPVSLKYVFEEYLDQNNIPVRIPGHLEAELIRKAKKVLTLQRQGFSLLFPDSLAIESILLKELKKQ